MEYKIFDAQEAIDRIGDEELIYELLEDVIELAEETDEQISNGIKNGDFEAVRVAGHTLKGTAANLALHQLSEAGKRFEMAGKEQDSSNFDEYYQFLTDAINSFKEFLANR